MEKHILAYTLLLVVHALHIFGKLLSDQGFIQKLYGSLQSFLLVSVSLWIISLVILFFVAQQRPWAYTFSIFYGSIMVVEGLSYVVGFLNTSVTNTIGLIANVGMVLFGVVLIITIHNYTHNTSRA